MGNQEKIGCVVLDLSYYSGEDIYTDGAVEDEMLEIVKNNPIARFPQIIEEKKNWPIFYHLSPLRTNIIDWIPFQKTDKVLEIGSGCGAITGAVAKKAGQVVCIELSKKRSLVNAYRNKEQDNITIMVGNFQDIEPMLPTDFDYVLLIGVFEYGRAYIGGTTPYQDFMEICNRHRKPEGQMMIAIENQFGLKYWAGCREDHLGTYFSGLEGYHGGGSARTFTRRGLEALMEQVGITEYTFYYPYPDYKFATMIYSDRYLPKKGELSNNLRNFDQERVLLFDEKQVFDQIIEEQVFPLFSNAYLLVIGKRPDMAYTKFSNDRGEKWAIRTAIVEDAPGHFHVEKIPHTPAANGHIVNTLHAYRLLSQRYEGTKIKINRCRTIDRAADKGLAFSFCKGTTLETLLDACLAAADMDGFRKWITEYMEWLYYRETEFTISNLDFIFPNIIVDGEDWHIIDYEWTFEKRVDAKDIAFRAFYNYILGSEMRKSCEDLLMQEVLGFSQEQIAAAAEEEQEFQHYINGDHASVPQMRELIGFRAYALKGMLEYCIFANVKFVAQIFVDYGEGFSEEHSRTFHDCFIEERNLRLVYDIPEGAVKVRIDPCAYCCVVDIRNIQIGDKKYTQEEVEVNGYRQACGSIVFESTDPNIVIPVEQSGRLMVDMEVLELPEKLAKQFAVTPEAAVPEEAKEDVVARAKGFIRKQWRK